MIISAMPDAASRHRQQEGKSGERKEFKQVLKEQKEKLNEARGLEGKAVGYNRNGQIYFGQIMQRAYN